MCLKAETLPLTHEEQQGMTSVISRLKNIPKPLWILGVIDGLVHLSAMMIFSISGPFMKILGASDALVGFIEGTIELASWSTRLFSGAISDYFRRRKWIIGIGYGLILFSRPLFALSATLFYLSLGRFLDRIGKGIQASPREALVADIAPPHLKGASFGLRHSLGILGSMLGALAAMQLLKITDCNYRFIFWISSVPLVFAIFFLIIGIKERKPSHLPNTAPFHWNEIRHLSPRFWALIFISVLFMLNRCSEVFLTLRAMELGFSVEWASLLMLTYNLAEAAISYPVGSLSDRMNRPTWLIIGFILLIIANAILAIKGGIGLLIFGCVLWGFQRGVSHSIFLTIIAESTLPRLRATAYGIFYLLSGAVLFIANTASGFIATYVGYGAMYWSHVFFGIICFATALIFPLSRRFLLGKLEEKRSDQ